MTEADATRKIMDDLYAVREQIHEETKHLAAEEYVSYFGNHIRTIVENNGYKTVRSKDGLGYTLQKCTYVGLN